MAESAYPHLFSPLDLGGIRLANRVAHASIWTHYAEGGRVTDALLNYYRSRARGGTGLIISEPLAMSHRTAPRKRLRAWDDAAFDSLQQLAEVVREHGSHLIGQLQDSGRGRHRVGRSDDAMGASALPDDLSWTVPTPLLTHEVEALIEEWAESALRLKRAGWSGIEISAGHGHLIHQFLSPWSNRREDRYGGDLEGRTRFLCELIRAIRERCGRPFVLGLKLPSNDDTPGSIDLAQAQSIAGRAAATGEVDYWVFARGGHSNNLFIHLPDAHGERHPYLDDTRAMRSVAPEIPAGALGYITDPNEGEKAIEDGAADIIFLGRPLVTDPAFARKARDGQEASIRYCVSCNSCWRAIIEGGWLACDNNPRVAEVDEDDWQPVRVQRPRRVLVIGGGIAGMEAAHTAAARGHEVIVAGASEEPGGKTRLHAELPGGENLSSIYDYQLLACQKHGVDLRFGEAASEHTLDELAPDHVILATGSTLSVPAFIPGEYVEAGFIPDLRAMAADMLTRSNREPGRVVIVDEDHTEMTYAVAELLSKRFEAVSIVTPRERIANDTSLVNRQGIYARLYRLGIDIHTSVIVRDLDRLDEAQVALVNVYNGREVLLEEIAAITYATARVPSVGLLDAVLKRGLSYQRVGDCRAPRTVMAATREGYMAGLAVGD